MDTNYILLFIGPDFNDKKYKETIRIYKDHRNKFKERCVKGRKMISSENNIRIKLYNNENNILYDDNTFDYIKILNIIDKIPIKKNLHDGIINKYKPLINYYGIKINKKINQHKIKVKIKKIKKTQGIGYFHKKGKFKGMPTKNHCMLISLGYSPYKNKLINIDI